MTLLEWGRQVSLSHLFLCLILVISVGLAAVCIHSFYFSPLRKYPGPRLAAISRIPYLWHTFHGNSIHWVRSVHAQYGRVVRIAPDELSFSDGAAWGEIYGHGLKGRKPMQKDERFYGKTALGVATDIVRANDEDHARLRRIFAPAFSNRALTDQELLIMKYVDILVEKLGVIAQQPQAKIDAVKWYNLTTFDIMADLTFGEPLGLLEGSEYNSWMSMIFEFLVFNMAILSTRYIPWLQHFRRLFVGPAEIARRKAHFKYCTDRVDRRLANENPRPDIWGLVLREAGHNRLNVHEMYANSNTFMVAGTETTATLLSGLTYYLLTNPVTLENLTREIRGNFSSDADINLTNLQHLEYLNACLEEGLRMYPPVPIGLPRVVPPEGQVICGEVVPGNIAVSVNQWATYRNPLNFMDPNGFHPERWLKDPKFASDKKPALQPFSLGPRNCLGKNFAYHEMRLILAKVLWNFDLTLSDESAKWLEQKAYFVWQKHPLMINVTRREMER